MKYLIAFLLIVNMSFSQKPLTVNIPIRYKIERIEYSQLLKGDWLVHRIHGKDTYEIIIKATSKDKNKAIREAIKAYLILDKKQKQKKWI